MVSAEPPPSELPSSAWSLLRECAISRPVAEPSDMAGERERLIRVLGRPSIEVAPLLLGALVTVEGVTLRLTEVEAYLGESDPGSHAFRGPTKRTEVMFGPPGHVYTY